MSINSAQNSKVELRDVCVFVHAVFQFDNMYTWHNP